jgi:hypothetical protein
MGLFDQVSESNLESEGWLAGVHKRVSDLTSSSTDSDAEIFCKSVLPSSGRYRIQYRPHGESTPNKTRWTTSLSEAANVVGELNAGKEADVYLSMASFQASGRGDKESLLYKRGFYIDLDCGLGKSYPDKKAAGEALGRFCLESGIPYPAVLVDSGNGLHAHWPADRDLEISEWQRAADNLKRACQRYELQADPSVTADAARILRVPDTHNRKNPSAPLPVRLLQCKSPHNADALMAGFERAAEPPQRMPLSINDDLSAGITSVANTAWFDDLPREAQVRELTKMLRALPTAEAEDRATWIQTLAQIASATVVPWEVRVELAWDFSQRSDKSQNESRGTVARQMESLGVRTNINALRNKARQHGYRDPDTPYPDRAAAERALSDRYLHVATDDIYFDHERGLALKKSAVKERESWRMPPRMDGGGRPDPVSILRDSPYTRRCDGFGFHPGEGAVFEESGRLLANQFRPYDPIPCKPNLHERRLLLRFLRHLFPRGSDLRWLRHLLDTYAFLIQHPGARVKFTMILVGAVEGSGKSTLMEEIPRLLFGVDNVVTVSTHELESNFTDYLARAWIVVFAEVSMGASRDAARVTNALKDNQTNAQLRLIEKNRPGRSQQNHVSFLGTSNDESRAMHLSAFDRRSAIFTTPAPVMPPQLATELYAFLNSPQAPGVLRYVAGSRRIDRFNPSAAPPVTESKRRMIAESRHPVHAEMIDAFEDGASPFHRDLVRLDEVRECLRTRGIDTRNLSDHRLGAFLRDAPIGAKRMEHQRRIDIHGLTIRVRPWVVRNFQDWENASDKAIRDHMVAVRPDVLSDSVASHDHLPSAGQGSVTVLRSAAIAMSSVGPPVAVGPLVVNSNHFRDD